MQSNGSWIRELLWFFIYCSTVVHKSRFKLENISLFLIFPRNRRKLIKIPFFFSHIFSLTKPSTDTHSQTHLTALILRCIKCTASAKISPPTRPTTYFLYLPRDTALAQLSFFTLFNTVMRWGPCRLLWMTSLTGDQKNFFSTLAVCPHISR